MRVWLPKHWLAQWLVALLLATPQTPMLARGAAELSGAVLLSDLCRRDDGGPEPDAGDRLRHGCLHACCAMASPGPLPVRRAPLELPSARQEPRAYACEARSPGAAGLAEARAPPLAAVLMPVKIRRGACSRAARRHQPSFRSI